MDEDTCLKCKKVIPCHKKAEKREYVVCEAYVNFFPEDDGIMSLEELQAINASIPEDVIVPDYTGCEAE